MSFDSDDSGDDPNFGCGNRKISCEAVKDMVSDGSFLFSVFFF